MNTGELGSIKIAIGSDHRGFAHKKAIQKSLCVNTVSIEWLDVGTYSSDRCDYPIYASKVAALVAGGNADRGILICGSSIGMAIVANRYHGIYAAQVWNVEIARFAAEHDNVNILSIPSDFVSSEQACLMISVWLQATFLGGHYQKRIDLIDKIT